MAIKVIGIGNENRCDDSVGILIARKLKEEFSDILIVESNGDGSALLGEFENIDKLFIIDAAFLEGKQSGEIIIFNPYQENLSKIFKSFSTHSFGLSEAISLGIIFKTLPKSTFVFAITGRNFDYGNSLSFDFAKVYEEIKNKIKVHLTN